MQNIIERRFILGDDWVYFKIYSGPKTLESILLNEIPFIINSLFKNNEIDKFFFIRYSDPHYHIRIRFHVTDKKYISNIIFHINKSLKHYINERLIWNVCTDTYNRELERYGGKNIEEIESFFFINSISIVSFLRDASNETNDNIRWHWGLKYIDLLLDKFGFSINQKNNFYELQYKGFSNELNINKQTEIQLDKKYRAEYNRITNVINLKMNDKVFGIKYIYDDMNKIDDIVMSFLHKEKTNTIEIPLNNLLSSMIHMHINRLFRTNQRMNEFVIYFFLSKFYNSQVVRLNQITTTKEAITE